MRKRWIILSVSLSVVAGSMAAFGVSKLSDKLATPQERVITYEGDRAGAFFTAATGPQAQLPDFTTAAENGVESVVYIENVRQVQVGRGRSYGFDEMDPFEFFFGPQGGGRQQQPQEQEPQTRERVSSGSGVIISEDGYIVSNNHVVEGATELRVTLHDKTTHDARLIGTDPATDIALLKIDMTGLRPMPFGNSEDLRLGEWVLAIGNPLGLTSTVTAGIVSAKGRSLYLNHQQNTQLNIESFIQTDAAVNAGNSGGALMTTDGRLVGINTIIKSPTGTYAGYSFAVPSSIVRKVVSDIREYGVVQRAMLGIMFQEIDAGFIQRLGKEKGIDQVGGVYIAEVTPDGSAEAAGIKEGDILTAIDGKVIRSSADVQETIAKLRPNDKINVSIKRDGKVKQIEVTLRNRAGKTDIVSKDFVDMPKELGATFRELTDKQKKELKIKGGIQVVSIDGDGVLARSRVQRGFIITAINDKAITKVNDLNRITEKLESIDGVYPNGQVVRYQVLNQ